jgi:fluoride ion exporter CrcB/FEX
MRICALCALDNYIFTIAFMSTDPIHFLCSLCYVLYCNCSAEELLSEVFTRTATAAALTAFNTAASIVQGAVTTDSSSNSSNSNSSSSSIEAGTMGAFRTAAAASNRAVQKLAEQVETVKHKPFTTAAVTHCYSCLAY